MPSASLALSFLSLAALAACGGDSPFDPGESRDPDEPQGEPRTYAMGWAPSAPRAQEDLVLAVIDSISILADAAIIQEPVPWPELLQGIPISTLVEERTALANYLRAWNMEIVWLVDPLDGLDRRLEPPALVEAGRSIQEPQIRELHESWVREIAGRVNPSWFGLASEINTLAALGDRGLYDELVDLVNGLAPEVRELSPGTQVFVSFQADQALGVYRDPIIDHFALIDDFDIDALGLSSYPAFAGFKTPADIPDDYLDPFPQATALPLLMVEGGWSSRDVSLAPGSHEEQVAFFDRYELLLDRIEARLWLGLTPTDLDIPSIDLPPAQAAVLANFAYMGIWDTSLAPKPAYESWARIYRRPLR